MEITEVRIKLMEESDDRLQAFCSITFDHCFVVRDLKVIEGSSGPFVAMPSRKLTSHCPRCGCKNHLRAQYCNQCGVRQHEERFPKDAEGRTKLYADIAHPINSSCREMIQTRVIAEYRSEIERAQHPDYVSRYDDDYEDAGDVEFYDDPPIPTPRSGGIGSIPPPPKTASSSQNVKPQGGGGSSPTRTEGSASAGLAPPHFLSKEESIGPADEIPPGRRSPRSEFGAGIWD